MSNDELSCDELRERLARAEALLESLRRGEVDMVIGTAEPLLVRFKSLVEENERLVREWQRTFDSIKDAVWVLDTEQRVLRTNLASERIFCQPAKAIIGKHCWEIVHGTQESIPECPILQMRQSLQRERMELQVGDRWFEVTVDPVLDADNRLSGAVHVISDITERKEMDDALRESEMRNRIIAELISDYAYIFRVTEQGQLQGEWITDSFTKVFGLTREEIDARGGWQTLVYHEDFPLALQHAQKVAGGQADRCEMRWVTASGEVRWLDDYAQPVFDSSGKRVVRIYGASQDITERKRAEVEKMLSRDKLIEAQRIARIGDFTWDIPTGGVVWSDSLYDLLGYDRSEKIDFSKVNSEIHHPEDLEYITKWLQACINSGNTLHGPTEYRLIRKDGQTMDVQVFLRVRYKEGNPVEGFGTVQDITNRKRAEAEMKRLTAAVEQSGDAIVITDITGIIQYVNPAFETITGYTRIEAIGQTPRLLKSGKQDQSFYQRLWETITDGRIWQGRMVNKRKDGTFYTEDTTISPVKNSSGQIVSFVAVKRDVTEHLRISQEQVRLQEQLQQAQKMESIGRLAGGVAHDFNNMLSIILGYGDIIYQKLLPGDPLREEVEEILKAGRRSADLTRQLLAFSRKQTLQPEVLDINKVIRNIEKMLRRLIGEDIELDISLSRNLSHVKVDPGQIEQVIMNLAVNARDAMHMGGKLIIETNEVELDETYAQNHPGVSQGKYVMLAISDTGCGMDKEVLAQIFDPFFTTKERGKGTGLGLATVYGIVKQSGGNIWVYSEPGHGSTFKIYLPATGDQPAAIAGEVAAKEESFGRGERILVVEDEAALRGLLEAVLARWGYKVTLAANGGEALLMVEEKGLNPDLVITDMVMPGMSGSVLVERLRRNQPNIKVLFMSGYTDNAVVHHGVLNQETPFIQKPFTLRDIVEKVRTVLQGG